MWPWPRTCSSGSAVSPTFSTPPSNRGTRDSSPTTAARPEPDAFHPLSQFYAALEDAIERLSSERPLFVTGTETRQVASQHFYGVVEFNVAEGGGLVFVDDLASARRAIEIIVHQGEGLADHRWADPGHRELTHYAKLVRIPQGPTPPGPAPPVPAR